MNIADAKPTPLARHSILPDTSICHLVRQGCAELYAV